MAQTLKCTHCGAVMKSANPIAAGKKVKCSKCAQVFVVAEEEEEKKEKPAEEEKDTSKDEGDDEGEAEEKPKKKSKASDDEAGGDDDKKKKPEKKGKGLMIGLIVGGLLLCCCCSGGGGGGWFVYDKFLNKPPFWGVWQMDGLIPAHIIGFENNGTGYHHDVIKLALEGKKEPSKEPNMKWKLIDDKTLEISLNDKGQNLWTGKNTATFAFVISGSEMTLTDKADSKATKWKKADDKKK